MTAPFVFYNTITEKWDRFDHSIQHIEDNQIHPYLWIEEYRRYWQLRQENRLPIESLLVIVSER